MLWPGQSRVSGREVGVSGWGWSHESQRQHQQFIPSLCSSPGRRAPDQSSQCTSGKMNAHKWYLISKEHIHNYFKNISFSQGNNSYIQLKS